MDFTHDPEMITSYLSMVKRDWNRAQNSFAELTKHWEGLGAEYFPGVSLNRSTDGTTLSGDVLGKQFSVEILPLAFESACFAQVLVKVKSSEIFFEAARFLLNRRGQVVDSDGAVLVDTEAGEGSARVYTSIIRTIASQSAPILSA